MSNKIKLCFKDPDVLYEELESFSEKEFAKLMASGMDEDEALAISNIRTEKAAKFVNAFMEYGEYLAVEFDLDAKTATVLKENITK